MIKIYYAAMAIFWAFMSGANIGVDLYGVGFLYLVVSFLCATRYVQERNREKNYESEN